MPCEKNEQRSEFRSGAFCCFRMAKKSTSKKLTSQCRPEEDPGVSSCLPGTSSPGAGKGKYKAPKAEACLPWLRNNKGPCAWAEWVRAV